MVTLTGEKILSFYQNEGLPVPKEKDWQSFVQSYDVLKEQLTRDSKQAPRFAKEMIQLSCVTKDNIEKLHNQEWVSWLWNTLAGNNSRLKEINSENLLQIQLRVLFFLNLFEKENVIFRKCVSEHEKEIKRLKCALKERFKEYDTHVHGYSEEVLTEGQKNLLVSLLMYLAKVDGEVSSPEKLLIENKIRRFGLNISYHQIVQYNDPFEIKELLDQVSGYDKMSQIIIYKNLVEMVHCDKEKEDKEEEVLAHFQPCFRLDEQDMAKIENDVREYIMGENPDAYVYLHTKDKRIKITPSDFKPSEEKKHELKESFLHLLSTGKEEKVMTQLPGSSDAVSTTKAEDAITAEDTLESLTKLGDEYFEKEEYTKAKGYFEKVLELDPKSALAYAYLGACVFALTEDPQEVQKAVELLKKSIGLDQNNADAYLILGVIFYKIEEYSTAVESIREVLRLKPDFIEAHELLVDILKESGEEINIIEEYHHLLEEKPGNPYFHWGLGWAYYEGGWEPAKALQNLNKAISLKPNFYEAYLILGQVCLDWWSVGDYQKAVKVLEKAIKIEPQGSMGYYWLGKAYHKNKLHKKAVDTYRKLKDLDYDLAQKLYKEIKGSIKKAL